MDGFCANANPVNSNEKENARSFFIKYFIKIS
jgi:hypothetical protein